MLSELIFRTRKAVADAQTLLRGRHPFEVALLAVVAGIAAGAAYHAGDSAGALVMRCLGASQ